LNTWTLIQQLNNADPNPKLNNPSHHADLIGLIVIWLNMPCYKCRNRGWL